MVIQDPRDHPGCQVYQGKWDQRGKDYLALRVTEVLLDFLVHLDHQE